MARTRDVWSTTTSRVGDNKLVARRAGGDGHQRSYDSPWPVRIERRAVPFPHAPRIDQAKPVGQQGWPNEAKTVTVAVPDAAVDVEAVAA